MHIKLCFKVISLINKRQIEVNKVTFSRSFQFILVSFVNHIMSHLVNVLNCFALFLFIYFGFQWNCSLFSFCFYYFQFSVNVKNLASTKKLFSWQRAPGMNVWWTPHWVKPVFSGGGMCLVTSGGSGFIHYKIVWVSLSTVQHQTLWVVEGESAQLVCSTSPLLMKVITRFLWLKTVFVTVTVFMTYTALTLWACRFVILIKGK